MRAASAALWRRKLLTQSKRQTWPSVRDRRRAPGPGGKRAAPCLSMAPGETQSAAVHKLCCLVASLFFCLSRVLSLSSHTSSKLGQTLLFGGQQTTDEHSSNLLPKCGFNGEPGDQHKLYCRYFPAEYISRRRRIKRLSARTITFLIDTPSPFLGTPRSVYLKLLVETEARAFDGTKIALTAKAIKS